MDGRDKGTHNSSFYLSAIRTMALKCLKAGIAKSEVGALAEVEEEEVGWGKDGLLTAVERLIRKMTC